MLQKFFKNKNISKELLLRLKNTIIDKTLTYASENGTVIERDRKQLNVFERKVYRKILGPVYDNENENWRILTNKVIYASVKKPTIIETVRLGYIRLVWACTENGRKWNSQKSIIYEFGNNKIERQTKK